MLPDIRCRKVHGKNGGRVLARPLVQDAIQAERKKLDSLLDVKRRRLLAELAAVALSSVQDLYDDDGNLIPIPDLPEHTARAIRTMDFDVDGNLKKITFHDKLRAIETIGEVTHAFKRPPREKVRVVIDVSGVDNE